jgi:hypothetical protein
MDLSWEYINRSQTHECGNWDCGHAVPFLVIHKSDFRCSADLECQYFVFSMWPDPIKYGMHIVHREIARNKFTALLRGGP